MEDDHIKWWKTIVRDFRKGYDGQIPSIDNLILCLSFISRPLVLIWDESLAEEMVWTNLSQLFNKIIPEFGLKNIKSDFNGFIRSLFINREQIAFNSVEKLSILFDFVSYRKNPWFYLWNIPETIESSELYIDTVYWNLLNKNHNAIQVLNINGIVDLLFDRVFYLIESAQPVISAKIINLLVIIFRERHRSVSNILDVAEKIILKIVHLVNCLECLELSLSMMRNVLFLLSFIKPLYDPSEYFKWVEMVGKASEKNSQLYQVFYSFMFYYEFSILITHSFLRKLLSYHLSPNTFRVLLNIINHPLFENPLTLFQVLFDISVNDKIWGRVSSSLVVSIIHRFSENIPLRSCLHYYLRRCFTFIGASSLRNKYYAKQYQIIELIEQLLSMKLDWVSDYILVFSASLKNTQIISTSSFQNSNQNTDFRFVSEVESVASDDTVLKSFIIDINKTPSVKGPKRSQSANVRIHDLNEKRTKSNMKSKPSITFVKQTKTSAARNGIVRSFSNGVKIKK